MQRIALRKSHAIRAPASRGAFGRKVVGGVATAFLLLSGTPCQALSFGDIGNAISSTASFFDDPLKLGAGSANILKSVEQIRESIGPIQALESTTNRDLKDRLDQVNTILADAQADIEKDLDHADQIIQHTVLQLQILSANIFSAAENIVEQARCVAVNFADVQAPNAVKNSVAALAQAHPGITLLGVRIISIDADNVVLDDPYTAYLSVRNQYLVDLNSLSPNASIDFVHRAYGNIQAAAHDAMCNYRGMETERELYRQMTYYGGLEARWTRISTQ